MPNIYLPRLGFKVNNASLNGTKNINPQGPYFIHNFRAVIYKIV
jgi:hypothetical protein